MIRVNYHYILALITTREVIDHPANTMMNEIGHCCNIFDHCWTSIADLMYPDSHDAKGNTRGDRITWGKGILFAVRVM